jgi:hypothetical protein
MPPLKFVVKKICVLEFLRTKNFLDFQKFSKKMHEKFFGGKFGCEKNFYSCPLMPHAATAPNSHRVTAPAAFHGIEVSATATIPGILSPLKPGTIWRKIPHNLRAIVPRVSALKIGAKNQTCIYTSRIARHFQIVKVKRADSTALLPFLFIY